MIENFQFFKPEEKTIGQIIQPYQGPSQVLPQKSVIISGFPYDEGTRINGGRIGGSVASTIFRKTLTQIQLYPLQEVNIFNSGDIETDMQLPQAHKQIEQKHQNILQRKQNILLVSIGGSNDQSYPNVSALLAVNANKVGVINIDSHFDVRPLKEGKAHSGSPFRLLLEDPRFLQNGGQFIEFASKGATCAQSHLTYLEEKNCKVYWMEKVIRRHKIEQNVKWRTQGGQMFAKVLNEMSEICRTIFVSFDVDSINSKWMPGVSAPSVAGGLTSEQAIEIVEITGLNKKVCLVDFSQFNPAVESVLSSHLLAQLFYSLSMAFAKRT